jgi:hypothetical protein
VVHVFLFANPISGSRKAVQFLNSGSIRETTIMLKESRKRAKVKVYNMIERSETGKAAEEMIKL